MSFWTTYRTIREASRWHPPILHETAGDEGERVALNVVERLMTKRGRGLGCRSYPAVRVPRPGERGKYEIDLLTASPFGLVGLEVKHWGGQVEIGQPGVWEQISSQGERRQYDDPLALVQQKMRAVEHYLAQQGVAVPAQATTAAVVLTNERVQLGPQLAHLPSVWRMGQLEEALTPWINPNPVGFWASLARMIGAAPTKSPALTNFAAVIQALDRLPTWDLIELHGGRVLKGDIVGAGLALKSGQHVTRRDAVLVNVHMPRNLLFGWFVTPSVTWRETSGATHSDKAQTGTTLGLRRAGQSQDEQVPIEHITSVSFGCSDHGYYDAPKPPLENYRPGMVFQGTVSGVQDFGVFVNLDGHRDGLVHVSKLSRRGRRLDQFQRGQPLSVRIVKTEQRDGKDRIELDLDD